MTRGWDAGSDMRHAERARGWQNRARRGSVTGVAAEGAAAKVALPLSKVALRARVADRVAGVTVEQTFANPHREHLEAVYVFPLAGGAAVSAFELRVDDTDLVPDASRITPPRLVPGFDPKVALGIEVELALPAGGVFEGLAFSQHATRTAPGDQTLGPRDRFAIQAFDDRVEWMPSARCRRAGRTRPRSRRRREGLLPTSQRRETGRSAIPRGRPA